MTDKKSYLHSACAFVTRLGVNCISIAAYFPKKIADEAAEFSRYAKNHRKAGQKKTKKIKTKEKKPFSYIAANYVFPVCALAAFGGIVQHTTSLSYGISVEIDGENMGIVEDYSEYGKARKAVAEKTEDYETNGVYFRTARLSLRQISSRDDVTDSVGLTRKMENQLSAAYPEISLSVTSETTPDFEELIADENDPDVIPAVMVKAGGVVIGFVKSYDEIEKALDEMKSVCYDMKGVEKENVFFDKEITFEPRSINYHAVIEQSKIIELLRGNSSRKKTYEVVDGDFPILIAEKLGMELNDLMECKAVYNGREVSLYDSSIHTGTVIEIQSDEPFLNVMYSVDSKYDSVIEYSTIKVDDDTVLIGQSEVETVGENGLETITSQITYEVVRDENGNLTSNAVKRKIKGREIKKSPVSEVIKVGTLIPDAPWGTNPGTGQYFWPVEGGYISSHFGGDRHHKGLDIAAPLGTPIYAAASGTVLVSRMGDNGGYGNYVIIENDDGNVTYYAHQSELACEAGDVVEPGQVIGYVGSTGDSTGPHLHFEVRSPDGYMLDPEEYVAQE